MKPITKQLIIGGLILSSVTILSFGIRRASFSAYRADNGQPTPSARPPETEDLPQPEQSINADTKSDYYTDDSYTPDDEQNVQYVDVSDWNVQVPADDYFEENADLVNYNKAVFKTESFNGNYTKAKGNKDLQKIILSEYEDLYFTKEDEYWYVSEQPDGSTTKIQVKIDDDTGELIAVGGGYYAKQEPQRIPIGEREDIYLTVEGEAWYVSEQPDGETVKMQVQID